MSKQSLTLTETETYVAITAYYALSLPEYHMPLHTHPSCEIMYVTDGFCTVFSEDKEYTLATHQFIFLQSNVPHRLEIISGHPCSILNLEFCFQKNVAAISLNELLKNCPELMELYRLYHTCVCSDDLRNMGYAMKDLITQLQSKHEDTDYLLQLLVHRMMLELTYCIRHNRKVSGTFYLKKACDYIEQNLLEPLTVPMVAAHVGVNKSYLQLLFSRLYGCSIGNYINQKRLTQACFLLTNSSLRITDIAFSSGYNSRQHFAHTFEKFYGICPSSYRKLYARTLIPDTGNSRYLLDEQGSEHQQQISTPTESF